MFFETKPFIPLGGSLTSCDFLSVGFLKALEFIRIQDHKFHLPAMINTTSKKKKNLPSRSEPSVAWGLAVRNPLGVLGWYACAIKKKCI